MPADKKYSQACSDFLNRLSDAADGDSRSFDDLFKRGHQLRREHQRKPDKADRTRRALVRGILRELYGEDGPRGYPDDSVLSAINQKLGIRGLKPISKSTMRRARREQYGW